MATVSEDFSLRLMLSVSYDGPVALTELNYIFNFVCKRNVLPFQYHNHKDIVLLSFSLLHTLTLKAGIHYTIEQFQNARHQRLVDFVYSYRGKNKLGI